MLLYLKSFICDSYIFQDTSSEKHHSSAKDDEIHSESPVPTPGTSASPRGGACGRLLCDASTVITIQMTEAEQRKIRELKVSIQ